MSGHIRSSEWPEEIADHYHTVNSFPYPSCIYFGDDWQFFHNQAWEILSIADGSDELKPAALPADLHKTFRSVAESRNVERIDAGLLFEFELPRAHVAILTALSASLSPTRQAVLVQLLPSAVLSPPPTENSASAEKNEDEESESVAIDGHPFFRRFAEMIPSGLAILDHQAHAVFVNEHFHDLTTHRGDDTSFAGWPQSIHEDDYERVIAAYQKAFQSQTQLRIEFRAQSDDHPWRLLLLTPLGDENLKHVSLREYGGFICSLIDISSEKRAELTERSSAEEARQRKVQQERFIDMISHEIRNPLSAVMHCVEDITEAIEPPDKSNIDVDAIKEAIDTIGICLEHQERLVNDVLSFSKLDSELLVLAPSASQPSARLNQALKMFQPEFRKHNMQFNYEVDQSYVRNEISWVMADMARIQQILVNLITNAIKFTRKVTDRERKVTVSCGASDRRPTSYPPNVVFFDTEHHASGIDGTLSQAFGNGDVVYIMVAVRDNGIGIGDDDQRRLFERFRQATPKTEEVYGGSGLGLNISRKICHLHGGEVGVSSKIGHGSTFGFFFRAKRAESPQRGSQSQKKEQEAIQDTNEATKNLIESFGNTAATNFDPTLLPASVKSPPIVASAHAQPHNGNHKGDVQFLQTKQVADTVPESEKNNDKYGASQRPSLSIVHREKQHSQSKEVSDPRPPSQQSDSPRPAVLSRRHSSRAHILLVEDNVINQRIVFRKLETKGFNVTTANNGQEAVDAIKRAASLEPTNKASFDVVLMDQEMPVLDGNAATKAIRKLEAENGCERTPILGVTANVRNEQQQEMLDSGMDSVISKPYKIDELVKTIREATLVGKAGGKGKE